MGERDLDIEETLRGTPDHFLGQMKFSTNESALEEDHVHSSKKKPGKGEVTSHYDIGNDCKLWLDGDAFVIPVDTLFMKTYIVSGVQVNKVDYILAKLIWKYA